MIERKDNEFANKKIVRGLLFVAGCVPFLLWIGSQAYGDESARMLSASGWIGIGALIAYAIVAILLLGRRNPEDHYRCPNCQAHLTLRPWEQRDNREYQFYCAACDILWKTDVFEGET